MAQKVQVLLVCDLHDDEVEGVETISFGLDGASYEIDVCDDHANELRDAFAGYVGAARRAGRSSAAPAARRASRAATKSGRGKQSVAEIREWARENGLEVSERGRLPAAVTEAFNSAH